MCRGDMYPFWEWTLKESAQFASLPFCTASMNQNHLAKWSLGQFGGVRNYTSRAAHWSMLKM